MIRERDKKWLSLAADLAERGRGRVRPNPMVGCVLVKTDKLVGRGWHDIYGGAHAEVVAVQNAKESAQGSTAYVTLEPCNHRGITPPCSEYLITRSIKKIVYAASDPGDNSGGGANRLRQAGLEVEGPVDDFILSEGIDPAFFFTAQHKCTYLALKLAVSADGMLTGKLGERSFLTGTESNREVHRLRSGFDAIVVGANTARIDNPLLTVRGLVREPRIQPTKVILSSDGNISPSSRLFDSIERAPVLVIVTKSASDKNIYSLKCSGAKVERVASVGCRVDLNEAMSLMWEQGLKSVLCEGGAQLSEAFYKNGLAQRIYLFRSPKELGAGAVPVFPNSTSPWSSSSWQKRGNQRCFGEDHLTIYDREL